LIRTLADHLPPAVRLYENTPATSLRRRRNCWEVRTSGGTIHAAALVLANNAFCKGLGIGASRIAAMYTYAAITEPLPDEILRQCGSEREWGLLPAHRLGSTLRRTVDGRLLIRSLYGYENEADNEAVAKQLQTALLRRFPQLPARPFAAVWSGATGFTMNGAPLWGEYRPGLFISAGCNGGGVVKGTLFGRLLADRAHGLDTSDVSALFGKARWMPPDPLRRVGFELIAGLERGKARAEV
jgi:glycine/D-amino acid oxidase-like deaminating enzyme